MKQYKDSYGNVLSFGNWLTVEDVTVNHSEGKIYDIYEDYDSKDKALKQSEQLASLYPNAKYCVINIDSVDLEPPEKGDIYGKWTAFQNIIT